MIVNHVAQGWEILYHRGHALLAAQIASHWHRDKQPQRIAETITAIAQHDDLEREWEGDHLTEAGAPLDFTLGTLNLGFVEPWRILITDALGRGRWVALLTTMHISFLNGNKRGEDAMLDEFLAELAAQQTQWRKELGINKAEADAAYAFLQWCDRLSLILCQRALPERERWLEISDGPDGERYDVLQREDDTITIKPWPFRETRFVVVADARYLTQLSFKDNAELIATLEATAVHTVEWEFVK